MKTDPAKEKTDALLRDLWMRKLPMVREHLTILQRAAEILQSSTLTAPLRDDAAIRAHKLAGSLGMFGYPEGTRFARELEHLLDAPAALPPETFAILVRQLRETLSL